MTSSQDQVTSRSRRFLPGRLPKFLVFLTLAGLTAGGLWWFFTPAPTPPPAETSSGEKAKMETLSLTQTEEGGQRWKLNAKKAEYLANRDEIHMRDVYLEFYGQDQVTVYLWGNEGLVDTKSRDLVVKGDVKIEREDVTVHTPEVRYFHKEHALVAPEEVLLESPQAQVTGKDLHIDLTKKHLIMKQHRLTTVKLEKGLL